MSVLDNVKEAIRICQQLDNLDLYKRLLDLQGEVLDFTEEIKKKKDEIEKLKEALKIKGKLICRDSVYFIFDDADELIDGPFCTKCFDVDNTLCRVVPCGRIDNYEVKCQKCKIEFNSVASSSFYCKEQKKWQNKEVNR